MISYILCITNYTLCSGPIQRFFIRRRTLSAGKLGSDQRIPAIPLRHSHDLLKEAVPIIQSTSAAIPQTKELRISSREMDKLRRVKGEGRKGGQFEVDSEPNYKPVLHLPPSGDTLSKHGGGECQLAYYMIESRRMKVISGNNRTLVGASHTDCINFCSANKVSFSLQLYLPLALRFNERVIQNQDQEEMPCGSLNYYPDDRKCELLKTLDSNIAQLSNDDTAIHLTKFCLPGSVIRHSLVLHLLSHFSDSK